MTRSDTVLKENVAVVVVLPLGTFKEKQKRKWQRRGRLEGGRKKGKKFYAFKNKDL